MNAEARQVLELPRSEVLKLAAVDSIFYCRQFFPKAFRQESPEFHRDFWNKFENPEYDFFAAEMFRGSAKTTLTRAGISKRIAFGVSRNILSIAISETMAEHTIRWLKRQVEQNTYWTEMFQLRKGQKWTDDWIEIINVPFDMTINVIAKGMTSGLRGLNPDDWRPDFIMCDDICNDENTKTEEQRQKTDELFFGAIVPTLAPRSESPMRKLVLLQTGLHKEDVINKAHADPTFLTVKYPKLVEESPGVFKSTWEKRFPTPEAVKEKEDYTRRNQYHIYLREYGCKIISRETSPFLAEWLRKWTSLPTNLRFYIALDPATDSKDPRAHKAAIAVVGVNPHTADTFLIEYFAQRGKNPDEMWVWFLTAWRRYHPEKTGVETVAFQKFLKWYFQQKMQEDKTFFMIDEINDRRQKPVRISQALSGLASQGKFYVNENHTEFVQGFTDWDGVSDWDLGDAVSMAITLANPWMAQTSIDGEYEDISAYERAEKDIPDLVFEGGAP